MALILRPYQNDVVERIRDSYRRGKRAPLLTMPTGAGKTTVFTYIAQAAAAKGNRVLILVHRTELLRQASATMARAGLKHGIIAPGHHGHLEQVAVASVQTLSRRLQKQQLEYDLIIIDEADLYMARTFKEVLAHFPNARLLPVTATPIRLDGQGLGVEAGGFADELVLGPSMQELIAMGHLVKPVVYAPTTIDMTGARMSKGDFKQDDAEARANKPSITGSAVEHYRRLASGEPAIAFCASITHAEQVALSFREAGFRFEPVHGKLDAKTRADRLEAVASGRLHGVTSVDLLTAGTDIPCLAVGILLRPTASERTYLQSVGRLLRSAPNKRRAIILDHCGNCLRFGLPDDKRVWTLDGIKRKSKNVEAFTAVRQCKKCFAVYDSGIACPECGNINPAKIRRLEEKEGELTEITKEQIEAARKNRRLEEAQAKTFEEFLKIQQQRGYQSGWAHHRWKARQRRSS